MIWGLGFGCGKAHGTEVGLEPETWVRASAHHSLHQVFFLGLELLLTVHPLPTLHLAVAIGVEGGEGYGGLVDSEVLCMDNGFAAVYADFLRQASAPKIYRDFDLSCLERAFPWLPAPLRVHPASGRGL